MDKDIYFLKLDKKLIFGDANGQINKNLLMDFNIKLKNDNIINLYDILVHLNKNTDQTINGNYSIIIKNEKYIIKNIELNVEYQLDNLLIKFFKQIEEKLYLINNIHIKKLILINDNIPYQARLIIQQATLINGMDIIHTIDANKALRFYVEKLGVIPSKSKYISTIIKYDKSLDIAIYTYNPIRKLFHITKENPNILDELNIIIKEKDYMILDKARQKKTFVKIKNFLSETIKDEMGKQNFEEVKQIYIFNGEKKQELNKYIFLGASNSLKFVRTVQCVVIFKIIDDMEKYPEIEEYEEEEKDHEEEEKEHEEIEHEENEIFEEEEMKKEKNIDKIDYISINGCNYYLQQEKTSILLDIELPFEGCFYTNIPLQLYHQEINNHSVLITVYFEQINYYYMSLNFNFCNSIEFIFYKSIPIIEFNSEIYKKIDYEENFEYNEIVKRLCLINIDREKIKTNIVPLLCLDISNQYNSCTVIIGENYKIFSYFIKNTYITKSVKMDLYKYIKDAEILNSKLSLNDLKINSKKLNNLYFNVKMYMLYFEKFFKYGNKNKFNNMNIFIAFAKFKLFSDIFVPDSNKPIFYFDEIHLNKFKKVMEHLEKFHEKCKALIKNDDLLIGKLYLTASIALEDYLNSVDYSGLNEELIDLINFKEKETIYYSGYENNIEFILNFNKDSFLYPIFLQFNSGFSKFEGLSTYMLSKLTLQHIKIDLIKSLEQYGIRIFFKTKYFANTNLNTSITLYNEKTTFGKKLSEKEILTINDINFHKRTSISFLQKYERFVHLKKTLNKNEENYIDSPRNYIDFSENKLRQLVSINNEQKSEIGESLEYFLTNGNNDLIDNLFHYSGDSHNFEKLFKIDIMLEKSNEKLISTLKTIPKTPQSEENKEESQKNEISGNNSNIKYESLIKKENISKEIRKTEYAKYIEAKNKLINENPERKFTFEINTIRSYKFDYFTHKFVPDD